VNNDTPKETFSIELLRRYFLSGIAVIFPVAITIYIIFLLFSIIDQFAGKMINSALQDYLGFSIPGLGLIMAMFIILAAGFFVNHFMGRKLFLFFEGIFRKIPLISNIYPPARELSDFLFDTEKKRKFKQVVLVTYPMEGSYAMGFITNEHMDDLDRAAEESLVSVFVPLAPAPFSGFILLVPKNKIKPLDIPVEQAIKFIVSGGVIGPMAGNKILEPKK